MKRSKQRMVALGLSAALGVSAMTGMAAAAEPAQEPAAAPTPIWEDRENYSFEERAAAMIAEMTLEEKSSQMISGFSAAIPRLGIGWYGWWNEALHGVARTQPQRTGNPDVQYNLTSYPITSSLSATWDPDLMYKVSSEIGAEAREVVTDHNNNLTFWSPTVNLLRDSRWGRADESMGEDPYLTGQMATQFVNGLEGKDMNGETIDENGYLQAVATIKHYLGNNSEHNRLNGTTDITETELREYYGKVYQNIIEQSDVTSVMTSYNRVNIMSEDERESDPDSAYDKTNDRPASLDNYSMDVLLRATYGFDGYITSDCDSVWIAYTGRGYTQDKGQTSGNGHGWYLPAEYTEDGESRKITALETIAWAIAAGEDLECNAGYSGRSGADKFEYSQLIPAAVEEKIETEAGLFDENTVDISLLRLLTARMELGEFDDDEGVVSWYNDAVKRSEAYGEGWVYESSPDNGAVTQTEDRLALAREAGAAAMVLLKNDEVEGEKLLPLNVPEEGEYKVAVYGYFGDPGVENVFMGGYSCNMGESAYDNIITPYAGLKDAIQAVNPDAQVDFYKGFTSGNSAASLTTLDEEAIAKAGDYDVVFVYVGTDSGTANEQGDRSTLELPGAQNELIQAVAAKNTKTVVVMETISQNEVHEFEEQVPAMLWSCYNAQQKGGALADVVMGKVNPSGRTNTIWVPETDDMPNVMSYRLTAGKDGPYGETDGRTYMYYTGKLQYPFGYGLSYSDFVIDTMTVDKDTATGDDTIHVTGVVHNNSDVAGNEVVQLYVSTPDENMSLQNGYPTKRLVGFDKVWVEANGTATVEFDVAVEDLAFWNETDEAWHVEDGTYRFELSYNSSDVAEYKDVAVSGDFTPVPNVLTFKPKATGSESTQQVIFQQGDVIDPQITVSLTNDHLYGFISKDLSEALPEDMTITYTANRDGVVSIEGSTITAIGPGVVTITAKATYNGGSAEDTFVVYVDGDTQLKSLTVGGEPVANFAPDTYDYEISVPYGTTEALEVNAVANSEDAQVQIVGEALPTYGTPKEVKIYVSDGSLVSTYTLKFVMADEVVSAGAIYVGGVQIPGFNSNTTSYSIAATPGADPAAYEITASASNPSWTVDIQQPTRIPGTGTVTVRSGAGMRIYTIKFTTPAESVSFLDETSLSKVEIVNQKDAKIVAGEGLALKATSNETIEGSTNNPSDMVKISAAGDWTATIKMNWNGATPGYYQYFDFGIYQDDDHYLAMHQGDGGLYVTNENSGAAEIDTSGSRKIADVNYYRITKNGSTYSFYFSENGKDWTPFAENVVTSLADVELYIDTYATNQWNSWVTTVEYLYIDNAEQTMDDFALESAFNYTVDAIGNAVTFPSGTNTVQLPAVEGYTTTYTADNVNIISESGLVTAPEEATVVPVKVSVSNGDKTLTSETIELAVAGMAYKVESVIFTPGSLGEVTGDLRATVTMVNTSLEDQDGLMIVALYDPSGVMVNYSAVGKTVKAGDTETFEASFKVPFAQDESDGYTAKVFVWDGTSISNTNSVPLSGVTVLDK